MYFLRGVVREYKSRCVGLGMWHVWARRKIRIFYCLSTSLYKRVFAFPESRTKAPKIAARVRRQNARIGGWTPWEQNAGEPQVRTAHCTAGRDLGQQIQHAYHLRPWSANPTCLPPVQREQILRTLLWKMGADEVTLLAIHREHRIYTHGIIIFYNQDLRADAPIPSRWENFHKTSFWAWQNRHWQVFISSSTR
jgi:hypothetical protein